MSFIQLLPKLLICFFIYSLFSSCTSVTAFAGIELLKGKTRFDNEVSLLRDPKGILPPDSAALFPEYDFIQRDPAFWRDSGIDYSSNDHLRNTGWNEYFVYDEFVSLLILSVSPRYFIKIQSDKFSFHLEREYEQIRQGLSGVNIDAAGARTARDKRVSSFDLLTSVGDFHTGVYFTPTEMRYNTSKRIAQISMSRPRPDIWRLLGASQEAFVYAPCFMESQLLDDMQTHTREGKSRLIYTSNSRSFPAHSSPACDRPAEITSKHFIEHPANFSFIMGKNLETTEDLLDRETFFFPGEEYEITRDFIAFFSVPLGDANDDDLDYLDLLDGIVVLYRGNLSRFERFLTKDGFDFENSNASLK